MIVKTFRVLRNNPKKSILFGSILGYGANFLKQKYEEECLMRAYCYEAQEYGDVIHNLTDADRHITVILNPAANSGKGKTKYEKYCAPLLHLAGLKVALVRTEHEDQAKQIMNVMDNTNAIVVAGGDGTLSEILTGLFRREDAKAAARRFPLGILPLGETNSAASAVWGFNKTPEVKHLAEATMAIVRNVKRSLDVMEVTPIEESDESEKKPVYAASQLEWGAFRDTAEKRSDYWYWAFLKKYMVYLFSSYKDITWDCAATVEYLPPCKGCSTCFQRQEKEEIEAFQKRPRRWWEAFMPRPKDAISTEERIDYSKIRNEECGTTHQMNLEKISDVRVLTNNTTSTTAKEGHFLTLLLGKQNLSTTEFIQEGWRRENGQPPSHDQEIPIGELTLKPLEETKRDRSGNDRKFNIDSENFEVRSMKIRPKPKAVTIFAPMNGANVM